MILDIWQQLSVRDATLVEICVALLIALLVCALGDHHRVRRPERRKPS